MIPGKLYRIIKASPGRSCLSMWVHAKAGIASKDIGYNQPIMFLGYESAHNQSWSKSTALFLVEDVMCRWFCHKATIHEEFELYPCQ